MINIDFYIHLATSTHQIPIPTQVYQHANPEHAHTNPRSTHTKHTNTRTPSGGRNSESRCDPASGTLRTCLQSEHVELRPPLALSPPKGVGTLPALEQGSDIPMHPSLHVNTQPGCLETDPLTTCRPCCVSLSLGVQVRGARLQPAAWHTEDCWEVTTFLIVFSQQKGTNQLPPEEENLS